MEPPQLGTSRCRSPPVFVLAALGHMTVNLRRQLPTPSARCPGTPSTPEPLQLRPLRHPLSGHTQHLPSSHQLRLPRGPHSSGSCVSSTRSPMAQPAAALGLPPALPAGGGCEVHFLTLCPQKASGGLSSPHPCCALPCPRLDPARKVAAKDTRSPRDTGGPWDTPHPHKTPWEQEGAGCPVGNGWNSFGWNSFGWRQSCWKLACCGFGKLWIQV